MEDKKLFSHPRWNDIPKAKVIGCEEATEEEKKKSEEEFTNFLKKKGILKK